MTPTESILLIIGIIHGFLIGEIIKVALLRKVGQNTYSVRYITNLIISHEKTFIMYLIHLVLAYFLGQFFGNYLDSFTLKNFSYWLAIGTISLASLFVAIICNLKLNPKNMAKIIILIIVLYGIGISTILIKNPQIIDYVGNMTGLY